MLAMTRATERFAVGDVVPKVWKIDPRLDVVRVHAALRLVAALLAAVVVTTLHGSRPRVVLGVVAVAVAATLPGVMVLTAILQQRLASAGAAYSVAVFLGEFLACQRLGNIGCCFWAALHTAVFGADALSVFGGERAPGFYGAHARTERVGAFSAPSRGGVLFDGLSRVRTDAAVMAVEPLHRLALSQSVLGTGVGRKWRPLSASALAEHTSFYYERAA